MTGSAADNFLHGRPDLDDALPAAVAGAKTGRDLRRLLG